MPNQTFTRPCHQPWMTEGQSNNCMSTPASVLRQWYNHFWCPCFTTLLLTSIWSKAMSNFLLQCCWPQQLPSRTIKQQSGYSYIGLSNPWCTTPVGWLSLTPSAWLLDHHLHDTMAFSPFHLPQFTISLITTPSHHITHMGIIFHVITPLAN